VGEEKEMKVAGVAGLRYATDMADVLVNDGQTIVLEILADSIGIPKWGKPNARFSVAVTPRYVLRKSGENWHPIREGRV
jgi:hypothetical protein